MRIVTRFEVQRHMVTQMAPPEHLLITTCVLLPHFQSDRVSCPKDHIATRPCQYVVDFRFVCGDTVF